MQLYRIATEEIDFEQPGPEMTAFTVIPDLIFVSQRESSYIRMVYTLSYNSTAIEMVDINVVHQALQCSGSIFLLDGEVRLEADNLGDSFVFNTSGMWNTNLMCEMYVYTVVWLEF